MKLEESLNLVIWALALFLAFFIWLYFQGQREREGFAVSCEAKGGKVKELYKERLCLTIDGRIL